MSKIIFLDIDGVLNSNFWNNAHQKEYWFDQDLKPLRPEAENLAMMFTEEGLLIGDITPDHSTEEIRRDKKFSLVKAGEILAWLEEHEDVDNWIVIDDLDLHSKEIELHQVRTLTLSVLWQLDGDSMATEAMIKIDFIYGR